MGLTLQDQATYLNIAYVILLFMIAIPVIFFIKLKQPIYYGYLFWGLVLTICAVFFIGAYSSYLELFINTTTKSSLEEEIKNDLISNLKVLVFIIPGLFLAISANFFTEFLKLKKPSA